MAFTKTPKLCQNAPAGLQTLNALGDNLESFKTDFELEHTAQSSVADLPQANIGHSNWEGPTVITEGDETISTAGQHDHPLIPRGMAVVAQVTGDPTLLETYGVQLGAAAGCLQSMTVLDVGIYFFPIAGFASVWGHGTVQSDIVSPILGGIAHDIKVQPGIQSGTGATGLVVRTFRLQENDSSNDELLPFHTGFFLVAYGRRGEAPSYPGRVEPRRQKLFRRGPLRRFPSRRR